MTDFFPGTRKTIETLKDRGVRLALVTTGGSVGQRAKIERFSLTALFDPPTAEERPGGNAPKLGRSGA